MIKRMNKVTSLLIAAAAIVSLVPATGVSATERLQTKEGTIESAIAFDGGKYIYDGYKTEDDATGIYYNAGDKDKLVKDFNADSITKYGDKYAKVVDGLDEYFVDLTTGQVTNDETTEDKIDSTKYDLKAALKKADRYSSIKNDDGQVNSITQIAQAQFGDVWYQYAADGDIDASNITTDNADGTKSTAKILIPDYATGTTVNFGGKSYVCDNAAQGTKATVVITVPTITAPGTTTGTVKINGKSITVTTTTTQQDLQIAILAEVKNIVDGTFDFANATISGDTITVTDSVAKEYLPSQLTAIAAKYNTSDDFVLAGTQVAVATTTTAGIEQISGKVGSQEQLNAAILADVKANTGALSTVFDVVNATVVNGRVELQTKLAKEYYQSEYNTALTGYTLDGSIILGTPSTATTTTGGKVQYIGFTDESGKYIDASYVANMNVYSKTRGITTKIENFGKENTNAKLKVELVSLNAIDQNKDFIYAIAKVNVTGEGALEGTQYFMQKISKARGEQHDGAYLPKSVTSYQITDVYNSGDADDAVTSINEAQELRVINDVVYATKIDTNKVTVTTIKLKKDKVKLDGGTTDIDTYLAEQDVQEDQDIAGENAVSIDVDGNTWALNKGEIFKFDGTKFTTVYNVDRAFDTLDVYNTDSLIAWEDGEDAYATVDKEVTTPVETPVTTKGWVNTASGWTFFNADGSQAKGQWVNDGGVWYMIKADGIMATGWYNDNGTWYFLNTSGAMKTGWVNDNGTWYFLQSSGAMKTGWLNDNGTWYYLNTSGAMAANTTVDGYKLNASGAWVK